LTSRLVGSRTLLSWPLYAVFPREVSKSVHELFPFDFLNYALYSNSKKAMYLHVLGDAHLVEQSIEFPLTTLPPVGSGVIRNG
jgi:hypothetical protein